MKRNHFFTPLLIFLISFSLHLYKLDYFSLHSFDEAWYASIAKNITYSNQWNNLIYNNQPFLDHPPLGIWLQAISLKTSITSQEFLTRLPSALLASLTLVSIFFMGSQMYSPTLGLIAAIMLQTSLWYLLRARSANLDSTLIFFMVVSMLSILNKKYVIGGLLFTAALLSKSFIALTMIPAIIYYTLQNKQYMPRENAVHQILKFTIAFLIPVGAWYLLQHFQYPNYLLHQFQSIALRGETAVIVNPASVQKFVTYFRSGIGKWFWISILGLVLTLFQKNSQRSKITLWLWLICLALPLMLNNKIEIWHILPIYPPLFLLSGLGIIELIHKLLNKPAWEKPATIAITSIFLLIGFYQFLQLSNMIYPKSKTISAEAKIALAANKIPSEGLYLNQVFLPTAVFYSQKKVIPIGFDNNAFQKIIHLLSDNESASYIIVTTQNSKDLNTQHIPFTTLDSVDEYHLITTRH